MKLYTLCIASAVAFPALVGAGTAAADPKRPVAGGGWRKSTRQLLRQGALRDISESQIADRPGDGRGLDRQE